jgi:hypothetical protein
MFLFIVLSNGVADAAEEEWAAAISTPSIGFDASY